MINDNELERLAEEYIESERDSDSEVDAFIAGFRAAEKRLKDRFPSEGDIAKESQKIYTQEDKNDPEGCDCRESFGEGARWLKQKLFEGDEPEGASR